MVEYVNKKYKSGLLSLFCLFYREELQALLIGGHELQARASKQPMRPDTFNLLWFLFLLGKSYKLCL